MRKFIMTLGMAGLLYGFAAVAPVRADCEEDCRRAYQAHLDRCKAATEAAIRECHDHYGNEPRKLRACIKRANAQGRHCAQDAKHALRRCLAGC